MKKRMNFRLLSILCVVVLVFMVISTFAIASQKEMVQKWIGTEGGSITLKGLTVEFGEDVLTKDTKISIMYFGDGEYKLGPEIQIDEDKTFTLTFEDEPTEVWTFIKGEWIELECIDGVVVTNHFSRYRGCW